MRHTPLRSGSWNCRSCWVLRILVCPVGVAGPACWKLRGGSFAVGLTREVVEAGLAPTAPVADLHLQRATTMSRRTPRTKVLGRLQKAKGGSGWPATYNFLVGCCESDVVIVDSGDGVTGPRPGHGVASPTRCSAGRSIKITKIKITANATSLWWAANPNPTRLALRTRRGHSKSKERHTHADMRRSCWALRARRGGSCGSDVATLWNRKANKFSFPRCRCRWELRRESERWF